MDTISGFVRAARIVLAVTFGTVVLGAALASAQTPELGSAESFALLAATSATNTGASTITGNIGVSPGSTITGFPPGTIVAGAAHAGDAVAALAQIDASAAYQALTTRVCPASNDLTGQDLGGKALAPGVYCFDGAASLTGVLTLTGAGPWIFQIDGTFTTAIGSSVVVASGGPTCKGSNVFWQVGGTSATLGASSTFIGSILARTNATVAAAATIDGRVLALDGALTTSANTVTVCSAGQTFPVHAPVKVTGGGQIAVPSSPTITDPAASGDGRATYGFNAHPPASPGTPATGHLNYLNHVTGLHARGTVTDLQVVSINADGTPKLVQFSGVCQGAPNCTFSVAVEDNGEPGRDDRLALVVLQGDQVIEARALRTISHGNIQVHESLSTTVNVAVLDAGDVLRLSVSLTPGSAPEPVDVYLVLRLPDGQLFSWTGGGFVAGIVPAARNIMPITFSGVVLQLVVPPGAPTGRYTWLSALTSAGTLNLLTPITETTFTIK